MNELQIFEVGGMKCYEKDGVAYLELEAVARGLGFTTVATSGNEVVRWSRVDKYLEDLGFTTSGKKPEYIPENIFYRLAMKAKNETAEKFQAFVADEVIPSIRKHGAYMTPETIQRALTDPDFIIQLATQLKTEQEARKQLEEKVEADKPKVIFADAVSASKATILVGELAKILKQNGIEMGQNRLFKWLRDNGYLIKSGSRKNMPTQMAMERGLFFIKETTVAHADGHTTISITPKLTGKGQQYFINLFLKAKGAGA